MFVCFLVTAEQQGKETVSYVSIVIYLCDHLFIEEIGFCQLEGKDGRKPRDLEASCGRSR